MKGSNKIVPFEIRRYFITIAFNTDIDLTIWLW